MEKIVVELNKGCIFAVCNEAPIKTHKMSNTKLQNRIEGLEISAALQRELGNTTRAEMLQATINNLTNDLN